MARRVWRDEIPLAPSRGASPWMTADPLIRQVALESAALPQRWPFTVPAVAALAHGWRLTRPVTVLVGANGSGKSTLVEALAAAWGLDLRGGHGARRYTPEQDEPSELAEHLAVEYSARGLQLQGSGRGPGFFLRAETVKEVLEAMSHPAATPAGPVPGYGDTWLRERSHGEGYLQVLAGRFDAPGLYLLDEPETALTLSATRELVAAIRRAVAAGGQVVCATHSPVLAALPEAELVELGPWGIRTATWKDLDMVRQWREFFADPAGYFEALT